MPLGVVGIIYEARPNVTSDAMGLCIKTGNAVVLRGGSDAINSNMAIVQVAEKAAYSAGLPEGAIQLIDDTSREAATYMMGLNGIIDVLIPRGGGGADSIGCKKRFGAGDRNRCGATATFTLMTAQTLIWV